ncbi:benzoate 4-monooxygenase cytochrome P450 [Xylariaceae sp. FL0255]|nr:benzoate 4-monooxygenase cytochrome P450 [Xylariaceae sp. FL0255]
MASSHLVTAFALGVCAHLGIFIRGEWHIQAPWILLSHVVSFEGLVVLFMYHDSLSFSESLAGARTLFTSYVLGLILSIATYRLYFHRLAKFPGPRLVSLTKLWHVWKCRDSKNHEVLTDWHQAYGTFVRTGPNELTIFHPSALEVLDGPKNHNQRSDWYDILFPKIFSIFSRNVAVHDERRKLWDTAMSAGRLPQYFSRIQRQVQIFDNVINESLGQPVLMNDLVSWFAFDCMGDFGFGQVLGMMKSRRWLDAIIYMRSSWALLGVFTPAIWLPRIAFTLFPIWIVRDWLKALEFSESLLETRLKEDRDDKDIVSEFIREWRRQGSSDKDKLDYVKLSGDASVLLFTGTDTTSGSLTIALYHLACHPDHVATIQKELDGVDITDVSALKSLKHLTGTINESMRLLPAALTTSPGSRRTPPEGLTVDGTFIPGGVNICTSRYVIGRLSSAYEDPESFVPERWYSKPEMVKDKRAFAPFGIGRYGCVGKAIAMTQLRLVIACLLSKYNISFAPGEGMGEAVERDMKDQTTAHPGNLVLVFEKRGTHQK